MPPVGLCWIEVMDGHQHERRHHFRSKARPGRVLAVKFRAGEQSGWVAAQTRDIGIGGAFIVSQDLRPVGAEITLELTLPTSDQVFVLPAVVRWSAGGENGGMGVQFVGVDIDVLLELNEMFAAG